MKIDAWKIREMIYLAVIAFLLAFCFVELCIKPKEHNHIKMFKSHVTFTWGGFFPPDLVPHPHLPEPNYPIPNPSNPRPDEIV